MKKPFLILCCVLFLFLAACSAPREEKTVGTAPFSSPFLSQETKETVEEEPVLTPVIEAPDSMQIRVQYKDPSIEFPKAEAVDEKGNSYPVDLEGEYDLTSPGEYTLYFVTKNSLGERIQKEFTLTVLASPFNEKGEMIDGVYVTDKGFELVVKDGIAYVDGYLVANKTFPLPKEYAPNGLVKEASDAYWTMRGAAPAEVRGRLMIVSGYRSWLDQYVIFRNYCNRDGIVEAETYSARPGHSEHQSGYAMDLVCSSTVASSQPQNVDALKWLDDNAWKFGFIKRYPENKTNETGYKFEPWHYRYVGTELAEILYNNGDWITMEDYFGFDSVYQAPYQP